MHLLYISSTSLKQSLKYAFGLLIFTILNEWNGDWINWVDGRLRLFICYNSLSSISFSLVSFSVEFLDFNGKFPYNCIISLVTESNVLLLFFDKRSNYLTKSVSISGNIPEDEFCILNKLIFVVIIICFLYQTQH